MGSGASAGVAAAVSASSPEELQSMLSGLSDNQRQKILGALTTGGDAAAGAAAGAAAESGTAADSGAADGGAADAAAGAADSAAAGGEASGGAPAISSEITARRVEFTKMVEQAIKDGTTAKVVEEVTATRKALTEKVRSMKSDEDLRKATVMLTLLQEQLHTARGLPDNWEGELKVCQVDGKLKASCDGVEVPLGSELRKPGQHMLVVTPLSRVLRKAHFQAIKQKKLLAHIGPAGTGKTESFKENCTELGTDSVVLSGSSCTTAEAIKACFTEAKGKPVAVEDLSDVPADMMATLADASKEHGELVCFISADELPAALKDSTTVMDMTIPPFDIIMDAMLSSEGFTDSEALATRCIKLFDALKEKRKEAHVDLGMRMMKHFCRAAGLLGHVKGYSDEKVVLAQVAFNMFYPMLPAADRKELRGVVQEHLGTEPALPDDWESSSLAMLKSVLQARHGALLLGVGDDEVEACTKALAEVAKGEGSELTSVPDTVAARTPEENVAAFAKVLEPAVEKDKHVWVVVSVGECSEEKPARLEFLNTVLDDNKCLKLPDGKSIVLNSSTRIVLLAKECSTWSRASVSRVGTVLVDGAKGW